DGGGLVAASRVEGARDLPLLVEDVAALLDPARDEQVAVDAKEVLAVETCFLHFLERANGLGCTYGHASFPSRLAGRPNSNDPVRRSGVWPAVTQTGAGRIAAFPGPS